MFDIAKVHEATTDAAGVNLTGNYLAQVPKHRTSAQATFTHRWVNLAIETLFTGHQFDDDQNVARILPNVPGQTEVGLPAYGSTDISVSRTINRNIDIFFGVQNLFDTLYYVGTNPTTIGTPRLVNGGSFEGER
jgi:outer membrane receptor protein involved in Fe transport